MVEARAMKTLRGGVHLVGSIGSIVFERTQVPGRGNVC